MNETLYDQDYYQWLQETAYILAVPLETFPKHPSFKVEQALDENFWP